MGSILEVIFDLLFLRFISKKSKPILAIIAATFLLFSIFGFFLRLYLRQEKPLKQTLAEGDEIIKAINDYKLQNKKLPDSLGVVVGNNPLRQQWLYDQWNNPYQYKITKPDKFILFSVGKDGIPNTKDDVPLSKN